MTKLTGREPQLGGKEKLGRGAAVKLTNQLILTSAKDMMAIAYADAVSQQGKAWLRRMGLNVDFGMNSETLLDIRILMWPGTPWLTLNDFAECALLVDPYNEFEAQRTVDLFRTLERELINFRLEFRMAREYSVAVYMQVLTHEGSRRTLSNPALEILSVGLVADEIDHDFSEGYRFWWD